MAQVTVEQAFQIAVQHHQAGKLAEAERLYRQILARQPSHADALHYVGLIAVQSGRDDMAVDLIRQSIGFQPNNPAAQCNLGLALRGRGQLDEAIAAFRHAIALDPNFSQGHCNLGSAMKDKGDLDQAIAAYRRAVALTPNDPQVHSNLGDALTEKGQLDEAIAASRKSIALDPNIPQGHDNLGAALQAGGQFQEAIAAYRRAVTLDPGLAHARFNLGSALQASGRLDEAIVEYQRAVALNPAYAQARWNLALALLARGDFAQGWQEYEWRLKGGNPASAQRVFSQPTWDGRHLVEETLLIHAEQGLGDTRQFIRYLPLVRRRVRKIIVQCQAEVQRFLQTMADDCSVVAEGERIPLFDVHIPLLSLPRLFEATLATIPQQVPYLRADPAQARKWQKRLAEDTSCLNVGLVWAGRKEHTNDRNRSMPLSSLAPLGRVQGVRFYSLQKGEPASQSKNPPDGLDLTDRTADLTDFTDTAALIANLDLVISVDTSVAHLAGGLGKPVWVMLPFVPDWRWMLEREDSPWYPTMRLFRQRAIGDWESVILRVAASLSSVAKSGGKLSGPLSPVPGGER